MDMSIYRVSNNAANLLAYLLGLNVLIQSSLTDEGQFEFVLGDMIRLRKFSNSSKLACIASERSELS